MAPPHLTPLNQYRRDGHTILRNVFNPEEIASLRQECGDKGQVAYIGPRDLNEPPDFREAVDHLPQFLGSRIVLFGDSSCRSDDRVAGWSSRHFHVDARGDDFN